MCSCVKMKTRVTYSKDSLTGAKVNSGGQPSQERCPLQVAHHLCPGWFTVPESHILPGSPAPLPASHTLRSPGGFSTLHSPRIGRWQKLKPAPQPAPPTSRERPACSKKAATRQAPTIPPPRHGSEGLCEDRPRTQGCSKSRQSLPSLAHSPALPSETSKHPREVSLDVSQRKKIQELNKPAPERRPLNPS